MRNHGACARILTVFVMAAVLAPAAALADRLAVSVPIANIRSGPGTGYEVLWKVQKHYPVEVLEKSGNWLYFTDFEGDRGWVHDSLVADIPAVITVRDKCNVRSGPGTKNDILFTVQKGIPFRVIKRSGKWIRIEHADGDTGWIHSSLVW